jgi:hypothetical protein
MCAYSWNPGALNESGGRVAGVTPQAPVAKPDSLSALRSREEGFRRATGGMAAALSAFSRDLSALREAVAKPAGALPGSPAAESLHRIRRSLSERVGPLPHATATRSTPRVGARMVRLMPIYTGHPAILQNILENVQIALDSERRRRGLDKPAGGPSGNAGPGRGEPSTPGPHLKVIKGGKK